MNRVNPPPALRLPASLAQNNDARIYFQQIEKILFQLWTRTGGGDDFIDDLSGNSSISDSKNEQTAAVLNEFVKESEVDSAVASASISQTFSILNEYIKEKDSDVNIDSTRLNETLAVLKNVQQSLDFLVGAPIDAKNSVQIDYAEFKNYAPIPDPIPGKIYWSDDDGTLDLNVYQDGILKLGQSLVYYAKNTSGITLNKGTPVMFTGTVGASGKITFSGAQADGTQPAEYMMGVTLSDIGSNEFGYVVHFGLVRGFDTSGSIYGETWSDGDLLYFGTSSLGTWTNVKPTPPKLNVPVAVVLTAASGGSGSIFVRMDIEKSLSGLQDVYINGTGTPVDKDMLVYVNANKRWENKTPLNTRAALGLGISNPINGSLLIGNGATSVYDVANLTAGTNISITNSTGSITIATSAAITADLTNNSGNLIDSSVSLTDGAAAATGTLTNAPTAGNPTKWVKIDDNGTTRYIPAW